ncbi:hypothetical protein CSKR_106648 [Clonorchis sinensis]|uniref:Uncharacterized protein n=1 Tax=Clonorchis sinensis TaxID=79923 RepID=A0A419Q0Z5_CLOSI|nr:hypothetical protein CSKR_106648 [Clonorchis sinensis]
MGVLLVSGVSFSSFAAFEDALNQYMKENYVVFVRSSTGCPVRFCLQRQRNHLVVTPYIPEHNGKLSKILYDRLPVNRRQTEDTLGTCRTILKYGTPSCEVRQFVADEFGRFLTTQDIQLPPEVSTGSVA